MAVGHADQVFFRRIRRSLPIIIQVDPRRSARLNRHRHLDPGIMLRLSLDQVLSRGQGNLLRRFGVMSNRIAHMFYQVPVQVIDAVICVLMPDRFAIAGLVLIISPCGLPCKNLQRPRWSLALLNKRVWPNGRQRDRR